MGDDGTNNPPFERKDLDMSNVVDREISRGLQRARTERLAEKAHADKLKHEGQEYENKRKSAGRSRRRKLTD